MRALNDNEKEATAYLLGQLTEDEAEVFEDKWFADPACLDLMEAMEAELCDAYIDNELQPAERVRFEQHFLQTPERQAQFELVRALRVHAGGRTHLSALWRPMLAIAATVMVVATGVYAALEIARLRSELDATRTSRARPDGRTVEVVLTGGTLRGADSSENRVEIGPDDLLVRIRLVIPVETAVERVRVAVFDDRQREIISHMTTVKGSENIVAILPSSILESGDYLVRIVTGEKLLGSFPLTVTKR